MVHVWQSISRPIQPVRDHFVNAPCQSETTLHCNAVSHWLGAFTKWFLQPWLLHSSSHGGNRTVSGVYMTHGLQSIVAGITRWWLVGLNIYWDCLVSHCIIGSHDQWEFPPFFRPQWESLGTTLTASKCLSLWLCKGLKEPTSSVKRHMVIHTREKPFIYSVSDKVISQYLKLNRHMGVHIQSHIILNAVYANKVADKISLAARVLAIAPHTHTHREKTHTRTHRNGYTWA